MTQEKSRPRCNLTNMTIYSWLHLPQYAIGELAPMIFTPIMKMDFGLYYFAFVAYHPKEPRFGCFIGYLIVF